jgi:hypothetical protein
MAQASAPSVNIDFTKVAIERLKEADNWNIGQRIALALVLLWAVGLLLTGLEQAKIVLAVGIAIVGVSLLTVQQRILRPQTLFVRDGRGRTRAVLTSNDELTSLMLLDTAGNTRIGLGCTDEGSVLGMFKYENGQARKQLMLTTSDGGAPILEMAMTDTDTDPSIGISPVAISVVGSDRRPIAYLSSRDGRGYLMVSDAQNERQIRLGLDPLEGEPHLLMTGSRGGFLVGSLGDRPLSVDLLDATGKPVWSVPTR